MELIGKRRFTQLTHLMLTGGQEPNAGEAAMIGVILAPLPATAWRQA
ncbi:hypothetical protein PTE30175_01762 [Pandoraea terrae]|uniref:Uncharacterized protein n=1 Tax=Pandoraea terrae TaxID=1537710 RepID=A0A5E4U508_9BURK|nr:hypothetical protein [Pandoraea terrae]VVD95125.1 hypothetical protein PTE30175_01762 [Pandoraea terrae]